jgi:hypothetical protein
MRSQAACALRRDDTVWCWLLHPFASGVATLGEAPQAVPGLTGVREVAVGNSHACALLRDGAVRCWGGSDFGQLGDGARRKQGITISTPVTVQGISSATSIAAAGDQTCAVIKEGLVRCWGATPLGDGSSTSSSSPVDVVSSGGGELRASGDGFAARVSLVSLSARELRFMRFRLARSRHCPRTAALDLRGNGWRLRRQARVRQYRRTCAITLAVRLPRTLAVRHRVRVRITVAGTTVVHLDVRRY